MQKIYLSFYTLLLMMFTFQSLFTKPNNTRFKEDLHCLHPQKKRVKRKHCCQKPILIFSKDINCKEFIIDKPGRYILCEDIVFNTNRPQPRIAITIKSSDVTLDMGGHKLSQSIPINSSAPVLGIFADNVSSLSISNGSITDFTDAGIRIQKSTIIALSDISILRTGVPSAFGGLQINDSSDLLVDKISALNNFGCGMFLLGVYKARVFNSHFDDNLGGNVAPQFFTGPGLAASGVYLDSSPTTESSMILFKDCSFNRNSAGSDAAGMEVGPYSLLPVKNVTILRCEFLDNHMTGQSALFNDASGLALVSVDNYVIKDCVASGQRHPSVSGGLPEVSGATGFSINICNNGVIENCQAFDNVGQGSTSIGLRLRGCNNQLIKNCECARNINTGSGQAFGFYTDVDKSSFFPAFGTTYVFDSCVAQQNTSISGLAGGFKIANLTCSTIKNCISQENGIGIVVTDSNSPQILQHNFFKENIVQCNTISGITDQLFTSDNAYIGNIARSNGPAGTTNYNGLPTSTPIFNWSISNSFPATPSCLLENLNITP